MGSALSRVGADYSIQVRTGDKRGSGTDANIFCVLIDDKGNRSRDLLLDNIFRNDFERGKTDFFGIRGLTGLGPITELELWRDESGLFDNWYVRGIAVEWLKAPADERNLFIFPIHRWISAKQHYVFSEYDSCLPQLDKYADARARELEEKRHLYEYTVVAEGMPPWVKELPGDEQLPDDYKWEMQKNKLAWMIQTKLTKATTGKWKTLNDLDELFKYSFGKPKHMDNWKSDEHFGRQRLQHSGSVLIQLCKEIPNNLAVTSDMVAAALEGRSLDEAIDQNRMFYIDLTCMENIEGEHGRKTCAPLALFYLRDDKQLVPVALQLMPTSAPDNPVFLPSDPEYTWLLAKMFYNEAEGQYHQMGAHLGMTHIVMEAAVIAVHRQMSPSHPLHRLLGPHMLYLLTVNDTARKKLLNKRGWIDRTMKLGREGGLRVVQYLYSQWRIDVEGTLPEALKQRGVEDPEILPNYRYRDDAMLVYEAIKKYVTTIVEGYYDEPSKLSEDYELQAWAKELVTATSHGGCGFKGVPGNGQFTNTDDVIKVVTCIIFTCTVQHAAVNFGQYDDYAFLPNYPGWLTQDRPKDKEPRTEEDILAVLPDKTQCLETMLIVKILSSKPEKRLGDFEVKYMFDPIGVNAHTEFVADLNEIEETILKRNQQTDYPYTNVLPSQIPNAISV